MLVRLVPKSLCCLAIIYLAANCGQAGERGISAVAGVSLPEKANSDVKTSPDLLKLIPPLRDPLRVELGRSRLLRFPAGVRRTALSNADSSAVVQISPSDVIVMGIKEGMADLTVWPADAKSAPTVILVRVTPKAWEP